MAIGIIQDYTNQEAVMYDTTTMWAFGPVFESEYDARNFLKWADEIKGIPDVRRMEEWNLVLLYGQWCQVEWGKETQEFVESYGPFSAM